MPIIFRNATFRLILSCLFCLILSNGFSQFVAASIQIDGLTCSMCARGVQEEIKKIPFVESVEVKLNEMVASVKFKKGTEVDAGRLITGVKRAGFSVGELEMTFKNSQPLNKGQSSFIYDGRTYVILNSDADIQSDLLRFRFVDKRFSNHSLYDRYRTKIRETLSSVALKESFYFVIL